MSIRDLYKTLEISENASQDEIKKSYRKLSLKHHPDKNNGSDERFKEISEAYQILSDENEKKKYDMKKQFPFSQTNNRGNGNVPHGMNPMNDIFKMFFNGQQPGMSNMSHMGGFPGHPMGGHPMGGGPNIRIFRNGNQVNMENLNKPEPIVKKIVISLEQAYTGDQISLDIERWLFEDGIRKCENEKLYIPIHNGIDNNEIIILKDKGNVLDTNIKGDVKVIVSVQNTTHFKREGLNMILEKEISLKDSLCGFAFIIHHLSGKQLRFSNEPGTVMKDGLVKMISNYGFTRNNNVGNLCIKFSVKYPEKLTSEQVKQLQDIL
jgi:DnaJ-class molecular chaperone